MRTLRRVMAGFAIVSLGLAGCAEKPGKKKTDKKGDESKDDKKAGKKAGDKKAK